jgi:hypothetical protein
MLVGGLYLVIIELLFARIIYFRFIIGGTVLVVMGGHLLWTDFLAPGLGIKTWKDSQG